MAVVLPVWKQLVAWRTPLAAFVARHAGRRFPLLGVLFLGWAALAPARPALAVEKTPQFEMTFVYSYLAAPSWPESFPYGVFLGFTSKSRLKLGGTLGAYLSREQSTELPSSLSPGRHQSQSAVVLLATADYDLLSEADHTLVPFVGVGAGLMTAGISIIRVLDSVWSESLGEDSVTVLAVRAGIGLRCGSPSELFGSGLKVCFLTRLDYLWASGKLMRGTPYEFGGNLGGIALSLGLGF